jgi:hypothetical protein
MDQDSAGRPDLGKREGWRRRLELALSWNDFGLNLDLGPRWWLA